MKKAGEALNMHVREYIPGVNIFGKVKNEIKRTVTRRHSRFSKNPKV